MNFRQKLQNIIKKNNSLLCIGLDADINLIPKHLLKTKDPIFEFNKVIIENTYNLVCAYKPNIAFYEAYGIEGLKSLKKTTEYVKTKFKQIPVILDAKRSDIGNSSRMYAKAVFDFWNADAVTVFPNLGLDSLAPFLKYKDKLIILLIKTSNSDSEMFQDIKVGNTLFYLKMAQIIKSWNYNNIGIFAGSTYPNGLKKLREIFPNSIFLSAGLGAQKADIQKAVEAGIDKNKSRIMFSSSRSIIYAKDPRKEAEKLRDEINKYRI